MRVDSLGPVLLGVAAIVGAIVAAVTGIRGLRQTGRAQTAAGVVATRVQALAELEAVAGRLQLEVARLEALNDRDRARYERALAEKQAELDTQSARCADQIRLVAEAMETLRTVVTDEIAKASAATAIQTATDHAAGHARHPRRGNRP